MMDNSTTFDWNLTRPAHANNSDLCLWPASFVFGLGGLAGAFGNAMILIALHVSPELRKNRCNILVANLALGDLINTIYCVMHGVQFAVASVLGMELIAMYQTTCYYVDMLQVIVLDVASLSVLAIGIDRVLSLWRPLFYNKLSSAYIYWTVGLVWSISAINALLGIAETEANEIVVGCTPPTALKGAAFAVWNHGNIVVNILVVIAYALAYWKAKQLAKVRSVSKESILRNNRLLTSLVTFVCVYITSFLLGYILVSVSNSLVQSPVVSYHIALYAGIFILISMGCNFYIYYARSPEYRDVFRKILGMKALGAGSIGTSSKVTPAV